MTNIKYWLCLFSLIHCSPCSQTLTEHRKKRPQLSPLHFVELQWLNLLICVFETELLPIRDSLFTKYTVINWRVFRLLSWRGYPVCVKLIFCLFPPPDLIAKMAKRSRKESNSSEDEGGGEQEEEKEEGEASDEENEWKIYCEKKDNESNECESTRTLLILKIKLEIKAYSKKVTNPLWL